MAFAYPDGHQALFGVDLHVHRGERVAVLGPNGAGKTTLVLHLNGILMPGRGTVSVSGLPVVKENLAEIRRRVGIVFQDPDDQLFMGSVRDDVAFGPRNLGHPRRRSSTAGSWRPSTMVGMADFVDRPPHHLSFGQRRRVAVATVLVMEPEIIVLDEPSSNLDPASRRELADILTGLDVTLMMVTHDLPYALQLCPRAIVLSDGIVAAEGRTLDILTDDALMASTASNCPTASTRTPAEASAAPRVESKVVVDEATTGSRGGPFTHKDQGLDLREPHTTPPSVRMCNRDRTTAALALGGWRRPTSAGPSVAATPPVLPLRTGDGRDRGHGRAGCAGTSWPSTALSVRVGT